MHITTIGEAWALRKGRPERLHGTLVPILSGLIEVGPPHLPFGEKDFKALLPNGPCFLQSANLFVTGGAVSVAQHADVARAFVGGLIGIRGHGEQSGNGQW